jgi:tellurite resistance protein
MDKIYENLSILQIKILSLIAWVDGEITDEERRFYQNMVQVSPCSEETKQSLLHYIEKSPSIEDIFKSLSGIPKEIVTSVLRNAYAIAVSDGKIGEQEMEIIDKIALKLGVNEKMISIFHKWLELSFHVELIETKLFNTEF